MQIDDTLLQRLEKLSMLEIKDEHGMELDPLKTER